jgi:hypothetical protein
VDGSVKSYPLDGGVAVLGAGAAGGTTVSVVVVADWGGCGAGAGRVGGGEVTTGGSLTGDGTVGGGGAVVGGGRDTVGVGGDGTGRVGVVVVGTGSDGTVTVGTGTSIALPAWTSACAAANPPIAKIKRASLPSRIKPQTSDQQSATTTPDTDTRCSLG